MLAPNGGFGSQFDALLVAEGEIFGYLNLVATSIGSSLRLAQKWRHLSMLSSRIRKKINDRFLILVYGLGNRSEGQKLNGAK